MPKAAIGAIQKTFFSLLLRFNVLAVFLTFFSILGFLEANVFSNLLKFSLENTKPNIDPKISKKPINNSRKIEIISFMKRKISI